jgi:hypothetical protein
LPPKINPRPPQGALQLLHGEQHLSLMDAEMQVFGGCMEYSETDLASRMSERQMRLWNVLHAAEHAKSSLYRFLTVSRDEGTLGDEIARALAQRLGWRLYDKEIVNYIADNDHVRKDLVRQLDEKAQGLIYETISRLLMMPESSPFGAEEYHESLLKTLATLATHGDAILVGRGANFALQRSEHGLHVRTTGSLEVRIQRLSNSWQVAPEIARQRMLAIDADQRDFIRYHFKQDFDNLSFYSLVFNTDHLSVKQVVTSVLSLLDPKVQG